MPVTRPRRISTQASTLPSIETGWKRLKAGTRFRSTCISPTAIGSAVLCVPYKQTSRYEPVAAYLGSLHAEIATVAGPVSGKAHVRAVHFGGGSPTMLKPEDMTALGTVLRDSFDFLADAKISVEIELNDIDEAPP